jgi:hypothetical protein
LAARGRTGRHTHKPLAPPRADACNPLLQAHPTWARDKHEGRGFPLLRLSPSGFFPPFALRLAPTHLGWGTRQQFTRRSRDPPGSKRRHTRTLVTPYCKRTRPGRGTNTKVAGFPFTSVSLRFFAPSRSISRRPIWAGARGDNLLVGPGTPGVETPIVLVLDGLLKL